MWNISTSPLPEGSVMDDPSGCKLKEIGKVPLLSPDEEIELAKKNRSSVTRRQRRSLRSQNLRLVVSIAKR